MKWYWIVLIVLVAMALGYGVKYMMDREPTTDGSGVNADVNLDVNLGGGGE